MTDFKQLFNSQGTKLAPFFICVIIYFVFVQNRHGTLWTTVLKCAPIIYLMLYIFLKDLNLMKINSRLILWGLIFSCCGDALLNIDLFPYGMGFFALAQICYILAFGLKPTKWFIAFPLYLAGGAFVVIVFNDLDDILSVGVPIYVMLLLTMCWRSLVRAMTNKCFLNTFCAIGSILFVISDALIGVDMFIMKVHNARLWIMSTYYVAQLAIALSAVNVGLKDQFSKHSKGRNNNTS